MALYQTEQAARFEVHDRLWGDHGGYAPEVMLRPGRGGASISFAPVQRRWSGSLLPQDRLATLSWAFELKDPERIATFLRGHPELIDVLLDAYSELVVTLGNGIGTTLTLCSDPGDAAQWLSIEHYSRAGFSELLDGALEIDRRWTQRLPASVRRAISIDVHSVS